MKMRCPGRTGRISPGQGRLRCQSSVCRHSWVVKARGDFRPLAERLGVVASTITVVTGHTSPAKFVTIDGMNDDAPRAVIAVMAVSG